MARGYLSGVIWGAAVSVLGVGALSVMQGPADNALRAVPDAAPVEVAAVPDPDPDPVPDPAPEAIWEGDPKPEADTAERAPAEPARRPDPETAVARPAGPESGLDAPEVSAPGGADTDPLGRPVVGAAPEAPVAEIPDGTPAAVSPGPDAPVVAGGVAGGPPQPSPDSEPVILTGPVQPAPPSVPTGPSALAPADPVPEAETPEVAAPAPEADLPRPVPEAAETPDPTPVAETTRRPVIGTPATTLTARAPAPEPEPVPEAADADAADAGDPPPLVRFAAEAEAADGVPRVAVVLIDDGRGPLGPEALESFPFPVSFAIAPTHPDPAAAASGYRARGFEVLVLGSLPEGAQATDVEVAMQGLLTAVPEVVAVLEDPPGSLQASREMSEQVAAVLGASGHGLVMQPKGLNTAQKLALREGVPSVTLFRDIDGEGQDASVIRRSLDQAAFRARQEAGVVMLGRLRADTISALILWGLQDRDGLALVPVSLILQESVAD